MNHRAASTRRRRLPGVAAAVLLSTLALALTPPVTPIGASFTHAAQVTGQSVTVGTFSSPPDVGVTGWVQDNTFLAQISLRNPGSSARSYVVTAPYTTTEGMYLVGSGGATAAPEIVGDTLRKTVTVEAQSEAVGILVWRPVVTGRQITISVTDGVNPPVTEVLTVP
jgi:hypothetical protein